MDAMAVRTKTQTILFAGLVLATIAGAARAQSDVPVHLLDNGQGPGAAPAPTVSVHLNSHRYGMPPARMLDAVTSWQFVETLSLRAGVNRAAISPCPATLDSECAWGFAEPASSHNGFNIGASWRPLNDVSLSLDYRDAVSLEDESFLAGHAQDPLAASRDLSLSCRLDTQSFGDLELGLQVSRWGDTLAPSSSLTDASTTAALGLGWRWGAFRSDVRGRATQLGGHDRPDVWNTFDISFAWRTPWNASLSVGARNLLDQPAPNTAGMDDAGADDFLGRVPYVRYQQDL